MMKTLRNLSIMPHPKIYSNVSTGILRHIAIRTAVFQSIAVFLTALLLTVGCAQPYYIIAVNLPNKNQKKKIAASQTSKTSTIK